ncbi:hypothetical protein PS2_002864 [Malus domestica]
MVAVALVGVGVDDVWRAPATMALAAIQLFIEEYYVITKVAFIRSLYQEELLLSASGVVGSISTFTLVVVPGIMHVTRSGRSNERGGNVWTGTTLAIHGDAASASIRSRRSDTRRVDRSNCPTLAINEDAASSPTSDFISVRSINSVFLSCRYALTTIFMVSMVCLPKEQAKGFEVFEKTRVSVEVSDTDIVVYSLIPTVISGILTGKEWRPMARPDVEELVVHLEQSMDLSSMEHGVKLVVQDEDMATKILAQVPWAVMKQNFSVKKWPPELALEEVGDFIELEDPAKASGFLRVKINVNTACPLINGCWLKRERNKDTWVEFRGGTAGYGEWLKAGPIRDEGEIRRSRLLGLGEKRMAGAVRDGPPPSSHGIGASGLEDSWRQTTDFESR